MDHQSRPSWMTEQSAADGQKIATRQRYSAASEYAKGLRVSLRAKIEVAIWIFVFICIAAWIGEVGGM